MKVEETTLADFDRVFAVNVRGVFVATQAALEHLKTGGRIIMIGSCLGERAHARRALQQPRGPSDVHTRAGVSSERAGITVNNVQPGPIDTDLNPASGEWAAGRRRSFRWIGHGHADEVAAARRVRRGSGVILHQRCEPDSRRRHQRVTVGRIDDEPGAAVSARIQQEC